MSTIACDTPSQPTADARPLDEPAWRAICDTTAEQAAKGCGLSYDYYVERFSSSIGAQARQLPEDQRTQALQIAREWGYETPAERQETQDWNAAHGYCSHGIELGCCPAGCGS
ncbi:hypothetical protein ACVSNE_00235 [Pseudomonas aeruginosa]|uniref:Uncharacterized protein n=3 Tax=Burkholderiales TaxID=80840 RepID=A0A157S6I9_9BORD|nr:MULTISPECIES: conserved plasmid protein [Burkholderiales]MCW3660298.1 hypothetical protein [Burkholderia cenocepacia]MCW3697967.1 hypothetical protein [Burkholderia cenocepacia]MCW3705688.1 hypothetical protein [Burkholderia cenocepacia]MCW3713981.1 hypothetical protein [Burkholderia cenocepacia]MCW3722127.1 hypothetical protein [Burkholderia cenocepacia]